MGRKKIDMLFKVTIENADEERHIVYVEAESTAKASKKAQANAEKSLSKEDAPFTVVNIECITVQTVIR